MANFESNEFEITNIPAMDLSPLQNPSKRDSRSNRQCLLISLLALPFLFYLICTARKLHLSSESTLFGIVISATPSASSIRVFHFLDASAPSFSTRARPSLSSFASRPSFAGASLLPLLRFAKSHVPNKERASTKLLLFASPELQDLGHDITDKLLESCSKVLRSSGFWFRDDWATLISGEEQGVYAWVSANYALGSLNTEADETTGIVELGGASMQVTFAQKDAHQLESSPTRVIKLFGVTYHLYSHSLPQFGQDATWESLHESYRKPTPFSNSRKGTLVNPCVPRGYQLTVNASDKQLVSSLGGNFLECKSQVLGLLKRKQDKCMLAPCTIVSSFPFQIGGKPMSANFLFTSELFGLVPRVSLFELEAAGQHFCEDEWDKQKTQNSIVDDSDLLKYCFSSAYMVGLLHDSLGIPMDEKRVGFANQTGNILHDWTLGAFIVETMLEPLEWELDNSLGQIVGNESVTYFSFFAFLLIAVSAGFFVLHSRKPQLKTIYDLEKGRYIITHVRR